MKIYIASIMVCLITTLPASAQFIPTFYCPDYKEGYYYTKKKEKISGWLKFEFAARHDNSNGNTIVRFKADKQAKPIKLTTRDMLAFITEKDSFAIIENFRINALVGLNKDFAKVVQAGDLNLYNYYTTVTSRNTRSMNSNVPSLTTTTTQVVTFWFLYYNEQLHKINKRSFKEHFPACIAVHTQLAEDVRKKKYTYKHLETIVKEYNAWKADQRIR
jgi:hypothetical protein